MSNTVDNRTVEMQFDNKHFEQNVQTSIKSLDNLKQSLKLDGATTGLENVDSAAKKVNLSPIGSAAETVGLKFNAMFTMADAALRNITNSAVNYGKRIVSALTIDPIKTGFSEYETQIGAVQTILANTQSKGSTLKDVNGALDELNAYADKTIYNFTEMTRNIGTFTAAGVDLDTSVNAIQGIANLAAVSGSTSQQASTAMYQLSQALASGTVKLMDWNSVVNAGMGGQVFQDALKETARVHGINIDGMIAKEGSFRETLKDGWLTSEILTETLQKFTLTTEGLTEAEIAKNREMLKSKGYTEDQIDAIFELGKTATDAATKVKTATQLWDTLKEAAQSGWTQTWEIIAGDFEEAKSLFSSIYNTIAPMIEASAKARNEVLQGWKDLGGRTDALEAFKNIFDGIMSIVKPIKEAFQEIFPPATAQQLFDITKAFKELTAKFTLSEEAAKKLKNTFKGIFAVIDVIVTIVKEVTKGVFKLSKNIFDLVAGLFGVTSSFGEWVEGIRNAAEETGIFGTIVEKVTNFIQGFIDGIKRFFSVVREKIAAPGFEGFMGLLVGLWNVISKIAKAIVGVASKIADAIGEAFRSGDVKAFIETINAGLFTGILAGLNDFINGGWLEGIKNLFSGIDGIIGAFGDALDALKEVLLSYQRDLQAKTLTKIALALALLAASLWVISGVDTEKLGMALIAIGILMAELMAGFKQFNKLSYVGKSMKTATMLLGMSAAVAILAAAVRKMGDLSWDGIAKGLLGVATCLVALVGAMRLIPKDGKSKAVGLIGIATAVVILAKAVGMMGNLSWNSLIKGLLGLGTGLIAFIGLMRLMPKNGKTKALGLIGIASAVIVLAKAVGMMGNLSWDSLIKGLLGLGTGLIAMIGAVRLIPKDSAAKAIGLIGMATAVVILGSAIEKMGGMSWESLAKGLVGMATGLIAMVGAIRLLPTNMVGKAIGLIGVATAIAIIGSTMANIGGMTWGEIAKGIVAIGVSMGVLAAGLQAMRGTLKSSVALLGAAVAVGMLATAMRLIGGMGWGGVIASLVAIAGALTILGIAAKLLTPVIPALYKMSLAMMVFGVGCALVGGGVLAIASALTALGPALLIIVSSIVEIIVTILDGIGSIIESICNIIIKGAPAIAKAIVTLLLAIGEAIVGAAGAILNFVFELLGVLAQYIPQIVEALVKLIVKIIDGLATQIPTLIFSVLNFLNAFLTALKDALLTYGFTDIVKAIGSVIVIVAALGYAMKAISTVPVAAAAKGLVGLAIVIAGVAAILAALGGLAQISGFDWIITEGSRILGIIGTAIGTFVGNIIGGFAAGATSGLPAMANNLSMFMANVQPFLDGMKSISPSLAESVKALAVAILALTGASFLNSIAAFLTGGNNFAKLGEQLVPFGQAMKDFAAVTAGIDAEHIKNAAEAGKALGDLYANIPSLSGVVSWFTGGNNLGKLSSQLVPFGQAMMDFASVTTGVSADSVIGAVEAGKKLGELYESIPSVSGVVSWFTGGNNLGKLAKQLVPFGEAMKEFSLAVTGLDTGSIYTAIDAGKAFGDLYDAIPSLSGVCSWFTGGNNLGKLGEQLVPFGKSMMKFSEAVAGMDTTAVSTAVSAGKELAGMAESMPSISGVASWFTGGNNLGKLGEQLVPFGKAMADFSESVTGRLDPEAVMTAANAGKIFGEMYANIPSLSGVVSWFTGGNNMGKFAEQLVPFGNAMADFSTAVTGRIDSEAILGAANAGKTLSEMYANIPSLSGVVSWFTGGENMSRFGEQLVPFGEAMAQFSSTVAGRIDAEAVNAAASAGKTLSEMAATVPSLSGVVSWFTGQENMTRFSEQIVPFGEAMAQFSTTVTGRIDNEAVTAAANAGKTLSEMAANIPSLSGVVSWFTGQENMSRFAEQLKPFGEAIAAFSGTVNGKIDAEAVTAAAEAGKTLSEMAANIPSLSGVVSWFSGQNNMAKFAEQLPKFGEAMVSFSNEVSGNIDSAAIKSASNAGKTLAEMAATVPKKIRLTELGTQVVEFGKSMKNFGKEVSNLSIEDIKSITSGFKGVIEDVVEISENSVDKIAEKFNGDGAKATMTTAITDMADNIVTAIEDKTTGMVDAFDAVIEGMVEAIREYFDKFKTAGEYLVTGFANGISANIYKAKAKAKAMAAAAAEAARKELDEHSPSKVGDEIGDFFGIAFVNGIARNIKDAYNVSSEMATYAKTGLTDAVSRIKDLIDGSMDSQPTIRPVLDLSDVEAGLGAIGGMGSSVGVLANVGSISTMMNRRQNGANSDLIAAVDKLSRRLDNVGNTSYNINGVSVEDDSAVVDAVKTIIRAAKIERRV